MTAAEITANAISALAFLVALASVVVAVLAYRLSSRQDERQKPALLITDVNSLVSYEDGGRSFAMSVAVVNPSDSDNAISRTELRIELNAKGTPWSVRLPLSAGAPEFEGFRSKRLSVPLRVQAHDTVAGWLFFRLDPKVLGDNYIERYVLEIADTHKTIVEFEPIIIQDFKLLADV